MINERLVYVRVVTPEDTRGRTVDSDVRLRAEIRDGESPLDLLAVLLAGNLNAQRLPRPYYVLAQVIQQLQDWHRCSSSTDHGRAEAALLTAAIDVVEAWEAHDEKFKQL